MKTLQRIGRATLVPAALAFLLAAWPGAFVLPHGAMAAPAAPAAPAAGTSGADAASVNAPEPDPTPGQDPTVSQDPDDAPWPGDEDDNSDDQPPNVQQQEPIVPPTDKGVTAVDPDSLVRARANRPGGEGIGQGIDSTFLKPAVATAKPLHPVSKERNPPLGLHPAVLFLGLLVGHIFAVRAVTK